MRAIVGAGTQRLRFRSVVFSHRIPADLRPSALARRRAAVPARYDLTASNPSDCGIVAPDDLLAALGSTASARYRPDPMGLPSARQAVAADHRRRGIEVDAEHLVLVSSTSEAYGLLFKLLADPLDEVLVPVPSYPLVEHLVALEGLRARPLPLVEHDGWQPHATALDAGERTRVAVVVHPNNPTGTYVAAPARTRLVEGCARRGMALVVDEVFHEYPLGEAPPEPSFAGETGCLTFTLGGLSKSVALPQVKLAWIAVSGPEQAASAALDRLSFIADQYLTLGTPVQEALPRLLEHGAALRAAVQARCRDNLATLRVAVGEEPSLTLVEPQGGWSAVLRFPRVVDEEALAMELLARDGVAVHPGYLFDFPRAGCLVVSLLPPPLSFEPAARALVQRIGAALSPLR